MAVKDEHCWLALKKDSGFRNRVLMKLLCISYLEHKTSDWVQGKVNFLMGPWEPLLAAVERLAWFGHVICQDRLFKTILQGTLGVG